MSDVHVCDTAVSSFVVVTVAPTPTCSGFGLNVNPLIEIDPGAEGGGGLVVAGTVVVGGDVVAGDVAGGDGAGGGGAGAPGLASEGAGSKIVVVAAVDAAALDAAALDVVVAIDVVVVEADARLALTAGTGDRLLDALTALWESPPQAPSPTAATTTSAVTGRMIDVPTARMYARAARTDCRDSVQVSIE